MEEVTVIPDVHAGGSLSTYAYQHMKEPIVVEHITVSKGIDTVSYTHLTLPTIYSV